MTAKAVSASTEQWRALATLTLNNLPNPDELDGALTKYFIGNPGVLAGNLAIALTTRRIRFLTEDERRKLEPEDDALLVTADQAVASGEAIDLGDGWRFTIDEVLELEVDYALGSSELNDRMGISVMGWEYVGTEPKPEVRRVKAAIGRMNRPWTEEQVTALLAKPGCQFRGSGAWGREAFLEKRPRYDGKGWIGFPDASSSRWRYRRVRGVCFPLLWGAFGGDWYRGLVRVKDEGAREGRLCLLCG